MTDIIWVIKPIEQLTEAKLIEELGAVNGESRFSHYINARKNLLINVLPEISRLQTDLTDHGPNHIGNVLKNAYELLGNEIDKLNCIELYCLVMSILFHDVGNFFDRNEHQKKISQIFDMARTITTSNEDLDEKKIILNICEAHCGKHADGSPIDTLKDVFDYYKLDSIKIRPNVLAPILRFADELAEGEQRTSYYMNKAGFYSEASKLYHNYSKSVKVDIDREKNRICLTYHILLKLTDSVTDSGIVTIEELPRFLEFCYSRIAKLDQERQYAKFFCEYLAPFKQTTVQFNFWCDIQTDFGGYEKKQIPFNIEPVIMTDLVVPGDTSKTIIQYNTKYDPEILVKCLQECINNLP